METLSYHSNQSSYPTEIKNITFVEGNVPSNSGFIWDFGKLPFPSHLGKYFIKSGKIKAKIHEIGKIKVIFWIGNDSHIRR